MAFVQEFFFVVFEKSDEIVGSAAEWHDEVDRYSTLSGMQWQIESFVFLFKFLFQRTVRSSLHSDYQPLAVQDEQSATSFSDSEHQYHHYSVLQ